MKDQEFDRLLNSIRQDTGEEAAAEAAPRVHARLEAELRESATVDHLNSCADFRSLFAAYRHGSLSEARRMLVEDHLHSCVGCRKLYQGSPAPAVVMPMRAPLVRRAIPWALAAAAVVAAAVALSPVRDRLLAGSAPRATVAAIQGQLYRVADAAPLAPGAPVQEGEQVRTGKNSRAVLRLRDGSTVEMAERSDLRIAERWSGKTIRLDHGAVMVEAAKQRRGRLQIATADCLVSVKGTIFEVTAGTKGSRVSVVEGEVKVDREGASDLLHRGDQKTTSATMDTTSVAGDVAWSQNAAKYLALLGELSEIRQRIEQIPGPGLRYESKLAGLLPADTILFAAIPNLGSTLAEATSIFEERVARNAALREWWNEKNSREVRSIVEQARAISDYLGDEIVVAATAAGGHAPLLIAQERRPGLQDYIEQHFAPEVRQHMTVHGGFVILAPSQAALAGVAAQADAGGQGPFLKTPFWAAISRSYQAGAGWIFAADVEQILGNHVPSSQGAMAGLDNVQYLTMERRQNLGRTENSATLSFTGARHGLASWLAAPGPMSTLDFVSPQASFAASFVIKNPATLLNEAIGLAGAQAGPAAALGEIQRHTGVNFLNDIAANLGGEVTIAVDGPLLPTPSWKVAVEVENPATIENSIEQLVAAARRESPQLGLQLATSQQAGLMVHKLTSSKIAYEIDYAFTGGDLLIAPSEALLESAIQTRASGATLERSSTFRAQLPQDGHVNFSALVYYNAGVQLGPIVDQLKSSGLMTPEQQKSIAALAAHREPGLIYAYGEPDRIFAGSRSGFFGLGLDTLLGLNAKGAGALPELFAPVLSIHGTSH